MDNAINWHMFVSSILSFWVFLFCLTGNRWTEKDHNIVLPSRWARLSSSDITWKLWISMSLWVWWDWIDMLREQVVMVRNYIGVAFKWIVLSRAPIALPDKLQAPLTPLTVSLLFQVVTLCSSLFFRQNPKMSFHIPLLNTAPTEHLFSCNPQNLKSSSVQ